MEVGRNAVIVDDSKLSPMYSSILQHYKNGTIVKIKSIMFGLVEIEIDIKVSSITLHGDEIAAIEVIA